MHRVDDDAGKPRSVERAFLEVEIPAAVLLREQPPLQPVGEPRHRAVQRLELLVEKGAQAIELVGVAQLLGVDDLVIGAGEHLVAEGFRIIEHREIGTPGLRAAWQICGFGVAVEPVGRAVLAVVEGLLAHRLLIGARIGG